MRRFGFDLSDPSDFRAVVFGGMTFFAFVVAAIVNLAVGPVPPKDKLRQSSAIVEEVVGRDDGGSNLVVRLDDGTRYVGNLGKASLLREPGKVLQSGMQIRLLFDADRIFEITSSDKVLLPFDRALPYWEADRSSQNTLLAIFFLLWATSWTGIAIWRRRRSPKLQ